MDKAPEEAALSQRATSIVGGCCGALLGAVVLFVGFAQGGVGHGSYAVLVIAFAPFALLGPAVIAGPFLWLGYGALLGSSCAGNRRARKYLAIAAVIHLLALLAVAAVLQ